MTEKTHILVVVAPYYKHITDGLLLGCEINASLVKRDHIAAVEVFRQPGLELVGCGSRYELVGPPSRDRRIDTGGRAQAPELGVNYVDTLLGRGGDVSEGLFAAALDREDCKWFAAAAADHLQPFGHGGKVQFHVASQEGRAAGAAALMRDVGQRDPGYRFKQAGQHVVIAARRATGNANAARILGGRRNDVLQRIQIAFGRSEQQQLRLSQYRDRGDLVDDRRCALHDRGGEHW